MGINFSLFYYTALFIIWIGLFAYAYHKKLNYPWGFSIVIVGSLALSQTFNSTIDINDKSIIDFPVDILLVVSLIGVLLNVSNIRQQIFVTNFRNFFFFVLLALLSAALMGYFSLILGEASLYGYDPARLTQLGALVIIARSIQSSLAEEFLFRGYFLNYLRSANLHQAIMIILQALIFTSVHIFRYKDNVTILGLVFIFGVVAGFITLKSNNIIPALIFHTVGNLIAVVYLLNL